jgi:hypothetical protein
MLEGAESREERERERERVKYIVVCTIARGK